MIAFGIYIAVNFVLPSLFTEPSMTGVPTARSNNLDALRTQQAERNLTATAMRGSFYQNNVRAIAFAQPHADSGNAQTLYVSCTAARGVTATPNNAPSPTPMPSPTPDPTPAAVGGSNFVFLSIVGEESVSLLSGRRDFEWQLRPSSRRDQRDRR